MTGNHLCYICGTCTVQLSQIKKPIHMVHYYVWMFRKDILVLSVPHQLCRYRWGYHGYKPPSDNMISLAIGWQLARHFTTVHCDVISQLGRIPPSLQITSDMCLSMEGDRLGPEGGGCVTHCGTLVRIHVQKNDEKG